MWVAWRNRRCAHSGGSESCHYSFHICGGGSGEKRALRRSGQDHSLGCQGPLRSACGPPLTPQAQADPGDRRRQAERAGQSGHRAHHRGAAPDPGAPGRSGQMPVARVSRSRPTSSPASMCARSSPDDATFRDTFRDDRSRSARKPQVSFPQRFAAAGGRDVEDILLDMHVIGGLIDPNGFR